MDAASIPALSCRESDTGWFAELIQIARHWDTAKRISAKPENKSMNSESNVLPFLTCTFSSHPLSLPMVQQYRSTRA
jgi:hypothetical protein